MKTVFEKIINYIHSEIERTTSYSEHETLINVEFFVENLAEEYNNGWISCSERLPEKNTWVLVTKASGIIDIDIFRAKPKGWIAKVDVVIAWQPLPPAFREKS